MTIDKVAHASILSCIGNTPIVSLQKLAPNLTVNLYGKCEFLNPAGSIKDRIALHMINRAETRGDLRPGATIIEATSGNTGMGLAMVAALRGYHCIFVMPDKQSKEKQQALRSLGAEVVICPTDVAPEDDRSYYQVARRLARDTPNNFYANQYYNPDNPESHYLSTGPEIYEQCGDSLDYLIAGIGTGGTISGISKYVKERNPKLKTIGVDPEGSVYFDLFHKGKLGHAHSYLIEGIGEDFVPETISMGIMDDVVMVRDEESFAMARRLVKECGLLVGGSTGAAVLGAIKYFEQHQASKGQNALVILVDSANRYQSKYLDDAWMTAKGFNV